MVARWLRIIITRSLWGLAGIRIGAISVDATKSHSKQDNGDVFDGQSYQIAYNKFVSQTSTRFGLAAWRYSSRDYRTFNVTFGQTIKIIIAVMKTMSMTCRLLQNDFGRKNGFSLMSQSLPEGWGSVSLSTLWRDYWGVAAVRIIQLSYSNNLRRISYTLAASQAYDEIIMKRNVLIFLYRFPLIGVTFRRLVGDIYV